LKHETPTSALEQTGKTHFLPLSSTPSHFRAKEIDGQADPNVNLFWTQALTAMRGYSGKSAYKSMPIESIAKVLD
jgi:hypothetical protein